MRLQVNQHNKLQVNFLLSNADVFSYAQDHDKMMTVVYWCEYTFSNDRFKFKDKSIRFLNSNDLTIFLLKWGVFS